MNCEITIRRINYGPFEGRWWFRVHFDEVDDWSGTAYDDNEAWALARHLYDKIKRRRLG